MSTGQDLNLSGPQENHSLSIIFFWFKIEPHTPLTTTNKSNRLEEQVLSSGCVQVRGKFTPTVKYGWLNQIPGEIINAHTTASMISSMFAGHCTILHELKKKTASGELELRTSHSVSSGNWAELLPCLLPSATSLSHTLDMKADNKALK